MPPRNGPHFGHDRSQAFFDAPGLYSGLQETLYLAPQRIAGLFSK
jgi:hypothetical protein